MLHQAQKAGSIHLSCYDNIETMWDMDFWHEFIDDMARNRYNALLLENINPYPSMVKVEGYEDIALDDVWRSNIPPDDEIMGNCTNIVRPEDWEDYTVVREMTIDEKIAFWQEVMAYAKDRGIEFHIKHSNIYTFVEDGQYEKTRSEHSSSSGDAVGRPDCLRSGSGGTTGADPHYTAYR